MSVRIPLISTFLIAVCSLILVPGMLRAADPLVATSTADAGPDFAFQGEYEGTITADGEEVKLGVQVIAEGNGKFVAWGYPGGLPGNGWLGEGRIEARGQRDGDELIVNSEGGSGIIKGKTLEVLNENDESLGVIEKVIRKSPTLGAKPPEGADVLFDGSSADKFENGQLTDDGLLKQGVTSKDKFGDCKIHLEFQLSYMPEARGQGRSNSGFYAQGRYEVQILDSFGLTGEHNECGGIYTVSKPKVNMCFPPLSWQTYDVDYTAARFDDTGKKTANARLTVKHNGVLIHDDVEADHATTASPLKEGPEPGPVYLQDHGNPVRFRNIWVLSKKEK